MNSSIISVLNELAQVHELARKLGAHLHQPSSQIELCRTITEEIVFSVEKAICMAKSGCGGGGESLFSNSSGQYCDNQQPSKKRKKLPTWTSQVNASTIRGSEGLPDDGYTWRKYGQKDILHSKHPRAYFRCTHRKRQGCLAMKQVQRSDDNPMVFEITYRGTHTCSSMVQLQNPHQSIFDQTNSRTLVDLQNSLRVKTESLNLEAQDSTSLIFFPSTTLNLEEDLFCSSPNLESCFQASLSSAFMSPTTSESNCLPLSPCQSYGNPKDDLTDFISMDVDFLLRTGEMDSRFSIETSNIFEWNSAA